jgi:hypothetical protein
MIAVDASPCPRCGADFKKRKADAWEWFKFKLGLAGIAVVIAIGVYTLFLRPHRARVSEDNFVPSAAAAPENPARVDRSVGQNNRTRRRQ